MPNPRQYPATLITPRDQKGTIPLPFTRQRYQFGSIRKVPRKKGPPAWEFRYREHRNGKTDQKQVTLSGTRYRTEAQVRRAVEQLILEIQPRTSADPGSGTELWRPDRFASSRKSSCSEFESSSQVKPTSRDCNTRQPVPISAC